MLNFTETSCLQHSLLSSARMISRNIMQTKTLRDLLHKSATRSLSKRTEQDCRMCPTLLPRISRIYQFHVKLGFFRGQTTMEWVSINPAAPVFRKCAHLWAEKTYYLDLRPNGRSAWNVCVGDCAKINRGDVESLVPFSSREINAPRDREVRSTDCESHCARPICQNGKSFRVHVVINRPINCTKDEMKLATNVSISSIFPVFFFSQTVFKLVLANISGRTCKILTDRKENPYVVFRLQHRSIQTPLSETSFTQKTRNMIILIN